MQDDTNIYTMTSTLGNEILVFLPPFPRFLFSSTQSNGMVKNKSYEFL